jgi:hypothetical protein
LKHPDSGKRREGKGYVRYCKNCNLEFLENVSKCSICGHETITREERINELRVKIEEQRKAKSMESAKWSNWVKNQSARYAKIGLDCQRWKPPLEEEKQVPPLTNEDVIKIVEEIEREESVKEEKRKEAEQIKEKGNDYIKVQSSTQEIHTSH